jgi:uncharacterized protein YyaL (SSP411 family)
VLKPYLPKVSANILQGSREEFLFQASTEPINWFPYSSEPFVLSRQTGKPILLVIGAPWSRLGRRLDEEVFQDDLVADLLARDYICVRIDGMRHQDWLNNLQPVRRLTSRFLAGCQLWVLDPGGRVIEMIGQTSSDEKFDHQAVHDMLADASNLYTSLLPASKKETQVAGALQRQDLERIRKTSAIATPNFFQYLEALRESTDPTYGGFAKSGIQSIFPSTWTFQLYAGDIDGLKLSLDPILTSPLHDGLDGGFYRVSTGQDCREVEFDKLTSRNAEMLLMLAIFGRLENDPRYVAAARRTWSYLSSDVYRNGVFASCRVGDEGRNNRSARSSFSPAKLRRTLSSDDRTWVRTNLGLDIGTNRLMCPFPVTLDTLTSDQPTFNRIVAQLKAATEAPTKVAGLGQCDTSAYTAARMLETARIWRDPASLTFALDATDSIRLFADGDTLVTPDLFGVTTQPLLPDYLSFADAELEEYLATGRVVSFQRGLSRLSRALETFSTDISGVYRMGSSPSETPPIQDAEAPEIADNVHRSCTSQIIRLCFEYGRLLGDKPLGKALQRRAFETISRFGEVTSSYSPTAGGYFASSLISQDDRYAIAVGPHAQELSDELFAQVPTRLVAPAFGKVRQDLQKRAPGIYIVRGPQVRGPFTLQQAVAHLPATYSLDPLPVDSGTQSVP